MMVRPVLQHKGRKLQWYSAVDPMVLVVRSSEPLALWLMRERRFRHVFSRVTGRAWRDLKLGLGILVLPGEAYEDADKCKRYFLAMPCRVRSRPVPPSPDSLCLARPRVSLTPVSIVLEFPCRAVSRLAVSRLAVSRLAAPSRAVPCHVQPRLS